MSQDLLSQQSVFPVNLRPTVGTNGEINGVMLDAVCGQEDMAKIWRESCAAMQYPDIAAMEADIMLEANAVVNDPTDTLVKDKMSEAVASNDLTAPLPHRVLLPIISFCWRTRWFSLYAWTHI